jgi:hypothetical protein
MVSVSGPVPVCFAANPCRWSGGCADSPRSVPGGVSRRARKKPEIFLTGNRRQPRTPRRTVGNSRLTSCPYARYGMGVSPYSPLAGGWLTGCYRKDSGCKGPMSPARQRLADRYDISPPANQRELDAAERLTELAAQAGITLIELAIAFVSPPPAATVAIIGPRTMEHLGCRNRPAAGRSRPARRRRGGRAGCGCDGDAGAPTATSARRRAGLSRTSAQFWWAGGIAPPVHLASGP